MRKEMKLAGCATKRASNVKQWLTNAGILVLLEMSSVFANAQAGAVISGQVVNLQGVPQPYATVRICTQTASGIPCTPLASIYADPGLATPITNPTAANQYGFFSVFVAPNTAFYQVQTTFGTTTYPYWANGAFGSGAYCALVGGSYPVTCGGTGLTSLTPYALLTGGTTSTGAMQQVSGLGTSGQSLISQGAGALPIWSSSLPGGPYVPLAGTAVSGPITGPVNNTSTGTSTWDGELNVGTPTAGGLYAPNMCINAFDYGVDPTGVADSSPGITAALNAAFTALPPALGGCVTLPLGTYKLMSTITFPSTLGSSRETFAGVTLMGLQPQGTIIEEGANNETLFNLTSLSRLSNVTLYANGFTRGTGIVAQSASADHIFINGGFKYPIALYGIAYSGGTPNPYGTGSFYDQFYYIDIDGCSAWVSNACTTYTSAYGVYLMTSQSTSFIANLVNGDTITVNGTVVTAVTSGASGNQFNIGATAAISATNFYNMLSASADSNLVKSTYSNPACFYAATYSGCGSVVITQATAGAVQSLATSDATNIVVGIRPNAGWVVQNRFDFLKVRDLSGTGAGVYNSGGGDVELYQPDLETSLGLAIWNDYGQTQVLTGDCESNLYGGFYTNPAYPINGGSSVWCTGLNAEIQIVSTTGTIAANSNVATLSTANGGGTAPGQEVAIAGATFTDNGGLNHDRVTATCNSTTSPTCSPATVTFASNNTASGISAASTYGPITPQYVQQGSDVPGAYTMHVKSESQEVYYSAQLRDSVLQGTTWCEPLLNSLNCIFETTGGATNWYIGNSSGTQSFRLTTLGTGIGNLYLLGSQYASLPCLSTNSAGLVVTCSGVVLTAPAGAQTITQPVNTNFTVAGSGTGIADFSGMPQFKLPVVAGYTAAASGELGHDSTNHNWHIWDNGVDNFLALFPVASPPTSGHVAGFLKSTNVWTLEDLGPLAGAGAGFTTGPTTSTSGDIPTFSGTGGQIGDSLLSATNGIWHPVVDVITGGDCLTAKGSDTSSGLTCANSTDTLIATAFATTLSVPANYLTTVGNVPRHLRVTAQFGNWTSATAASIGDIQLFYGSTKIGDLVTTLPFGGSNSNQGGDVTWDIKAGAQSGSNSPLYTSQSIRVGQAIIGNTHNGVTNPQTVATNSTANLSIKIYYAATGLASVNYASGGTISGTGTCALTAFNNGGASTPTANLVVTSGVVTTAVTVSATGNGFTAAPTSATATGNGSGGQATCSGTVTLSGGVLGGATGNTMNLQTFGYDSN